MKEWRHIALLLLGWMLFGCRNKEAVANRLHFTKMDAAGTRIDFANLVTESDSINVFIDEYIYNGSGVGVGDFNKDGLPDLFFCGSMVSSRLYINRGNFNFEDVTVKAGLQTAKWCTGVSIADVNNDGYPDIYVCASHSRDKEQRRNMLFINDGRLHFTDQAKDYGLADTGYSTQAAFFDYDKDGDLDMYLLNHEIYSHSANDLRPRDTSGFAIAQDRLYRNDGVPEGMSHPVFHDHSIAAGIREDGYGLGLVITDVNRDGWPDIYVANDYIANDLLWLNNRNGTFTNVIGGSMRHQSYNSMGTDAADINNDGWPDLAVADMLPETNSRKKMMGSATNQGKFDMQQRFGYQPSYVRNMLQLSNGCRQGVPFFSEIGQLAGIFETDWSWSVLMADLDNDGWKDIYITNGLGKDVTNNDYASFTSAEGGNLSSYGFNAEGQTDRRAGKKDMRGLRKKLDAYGSVKMRSYLFHNNGDLTFSDSSKEAGIDLPALANGAVYADLDNDGDFDLVVNNINQPATLWRNDIRSSSADSVHNFLGISLEGPAGGRLTLFSGDTRQYLEQSPVRGFSSCVDDRLLFGVGTVQRIDSLVVQWPDDKVQVIPAIKANQWLRVRYREAGAQGHAQAAFSAAGTLVRDVSNKYGLDFKHTETTHYDFGEHQPILQKYSQMGPCMATGDLNGDGLTDVFIGGAANQSGKIFLQRSGSRFEGSDLAAGGKPGEDLGAVFFDADGDQDLDLLVTGGSSEFLVAEYNQPRLYLNDGKGHFSRDPIALPVITDITKALAVADIDGDGDMDVFIGGRLSPAHYPQPPRSYILRNEHGKFSDVTAAVCSDLLFPGLVTDAIFADIDGDRRADLVICGEWMSIRSFTWQGGRLVERTENAGLGRMQGLWRCLQAADIDNDGDMDLVVGNMGLNNKYGVTPSRPMELYAKDMDNNGRQELIPAYYIKDDKGSYQLFPALDRNQLAQEIPAVKKKYLLHRDYSTVTMARLTDDFGSDGWTRLTCGTAATIWLENKGGGIFSAHQLPPPAQFAPVNCIVAADVDGDGHKDLIIAGNEYQAESNTGRYDASYGLVLKGDGKGNFSAMAPVRSGLILDGDIRDMKIVGTKDKGRLLLAAPNDNSLKTFQF